MLQAKSGIDSALFGVLDPLLAQLSGEPPLLQFPLLEEDAGGYLLVLLGLLSQANALQCGYINVIFTAIKQGEMCNIMLLRFDPGRVLAKRSTWLNRWLPFCLCDSKGWNDPDCEHAPYFIGGVFYEA